MSDNKPINRCTISAASTGRRLLSARLRHFASEDSGAMIILGMIFFVMILTVGGLAVDFMRHEQRRVQLQSLSDRAALAAASLRQQQDIEAVVQDYFEREGMLDYLVEVNAAPPSLNAREVQIVTRAVIPTLFSRLVGMDRMESPVYSRAEERVTNLEVSMVLDLSNSMNSFSRIDNLRIAGVDFVDTLFEDAGEDQISVSLVPYTGQVNAGEALLSHYTTSFDQPWSHCVSFETADFNSLDQSTAQTLTGTGHFDPWHMDRRQFMAFCPTHPGGIRGTMSAAAFSSYVSGQGLTDADFEPMGVDTAEIVVNEGDPDVLRRRLRSLMADGNTSIEIGMKWAAALLDPDTRPVNQSLSNAGLIDPVFADRPADYDDGDSMKIVVLMTDGENWDEWRLHNDYKQGPSGVWHSFSRPSNANTVISQLVSEGAGGDQFMFPGKPGARPLGERISVRHPNPGWNQGNFFIPDRNHPLPRNLTWSGMPDRWDSSCVEYGPTRPTAQRTAFRFYACNNWIIQELDNRELYATFPVRWVGAYLYHYPGIRNYWTFLDERLSAISPAPKDQRLFAICDQLRAQNIRVYAVAFEAPPNGVEAMRQCAFSANHFFDVNGLEISDAFRAIAASIQQLRLTQ